jgi:hypothetical protein
VRQTGRDDAAERLRTSSSASQTAIFPAPPTRPLPAVTVTALQAVLDCIVADNASLPDTTTAAGLTAAVVSDRGIWAGAAGQDGVGRRLRPETVLAIAGLPTRSLPLR